MFQFIYLRYGELAVQLVYNIKPLLLLLVIVHAVLVVFIVQKFNK